MEGSRWNLTRSIAVAAALLCCAGRAHAQSTSPVPLESFEPGVERARARENPGAREIARGDAPPAPRLVVALLFDQYRDDYLDRFRRVWGRDGFRRLIDGGARFHDCTIPYAQTLTGPGHATWLSGATPAAHGVVANEWFDRADGRMVTAADDRSVRSVGVPEGTRGEPGSPNRMKAQTVGDVLRGTTRGAARVIAISDKARGAILPAGRRPNGVYWLDDVSGLMQTSTYYASALPDWAIAANVAGRRARDEAMRTPWVPILGEAALRGTAVADPDDVFPHPIGPAGRNATGGEIDLASHPVSLATLFDFAEAAVANERLGADATPDLLVLSVSIPDRVGHRYGPDSPEVLDLAHRTDARLAEFLGYLDEKVGRGRYLVSITSDHGVATSPTVAREFETAPGDSVGGVASARLGAWVDGVITRALAAVAPRAAGKARFARSIASGLVTFDDSVLTVAGITRSQAARVVADSAASNPWLAAGFAADDVLAGRKAGALARQVALGFFVGRSGDVVLVPRPYVYFGTGPTYRASHGTPYRYDTHVPLVFYGWGVKRGSYRRPVSTTDIAPTVAALLGIDAPAHCEGRVLDEALQVPAAGGR